MKCNILPAVLLALAQPSICSATILLPGETGVPNEFVYSPGDYEGIAATILPISIGVPGDPSISGIVGMSVLRPQSGTLIFSYDLGSPAQNPVFTLHSIAISGFRGATTNLRFQHIYQSAGVTELVPLSAERSADGYIITFLFDGGTNDPGAPIIFPPLHPTVQLMIWTDATEYQLTGFFTSQLSNNTSLFVPNSIITWNPIPPTPVPEPNSLAGVLLLPRPA